jgi:hypothetical protein
MKIGEIKQRLAGVDKDCPVYFDFARCVPTTVGSWRGSYDEPAIGWSMDIDRECTVETFMAELAFATSGKKFSGYKGGEYAYTDDDVLHVDNHGRCTNTEIVGIDVLVWDVVILNTRYED